MSRSNKSKSSSGRGKKSYGNSFKKSAKGSSSFKGPKPEFEGTVRMSREGYLYVTVEGMEDSFFVPAGKARGALHGDIVKIVQTKRGGAGKRAEAAVMSIVKRTDKPFVGVLHIVGGQAWVLMQSKTMPYDISIDIAQAEADAPKGALIDNGDGSYSVSGLYEVVDGKASLLQARSGIKVAALVDDWPRGEYGPHGYITDVLGALGENDTEMHAILAEYGLPYRFSPEVEKAAEAISEKIGPKELAGRRDFCDTLTFTIDPADAKDFDDALSFRKLDSGNYEVGVHIADVSYYVKPGSVLDKEAQERGTSVYLVDRTVPMLPEKLSNKLCSLRPAEEKLTFSAVFEITPRGKVFNPWFGRTVIRSDWRFAYENAQAVLDAGKDALNTEIRGGTDGISSVDTRDGVIPIELKEALLTLWSLASIFRKKRFAAGAISFERPEMKVEVDDSGKPVSVHQHISKEANFLIEEFMLLANRSVAEFVATGGKMDGAARKGAKTFVYRVHDVPNLEKLSGLSQFAAHFGYKTDFEDAGMSGTAKELNSLLEKAKDKPEFMALEMLALRSMAKAVYSPDNIGHYGLAFKFYTHFTSPIRRYPDTMVHRLLSMYLDGQSSQDKEYYSRQCQHASEREQIAANAERDSIKYKLVEFMQDKIGQEFEGNISSLTEWGMYVEIVPTMIEGMVPLREIRSDFFEFDEKNYRIVGRRTHKVYRLGDSVRVRVKATSLEQRLLDYELVEDLAPAGERDREEKTLRGPKAASGRPSRKASSKRR